MNTIELLAACSAAADVRDRVHTGVLSKGRVNFRALAVHIHVISVSALVSKRPPRSLAAARRLHGSP